LELGERLDGGVGVKSGNNLLLIGVEEVSSGVDIFMSLYLKTELFNSS